MSSSPIEHCIEVLCHKGCKALWADIETLEQGRQLEETRDLTVEERQLVLNELKAIMAVYEGTCEPDAG